MTLRSGTCPAGWADEYSAPMRREALYDCLLRALTAARERGAKPPGLGSSTEEAREKADGLRRGGGKFERWRTHPTHGDGHSSAVESDGVSNGTHCVYASEAGESRGELIRRKSKEGLLEPAHVARDAFAARLEPRPKHEAVVHMELRCGLAARPWARLWAALDVRASAENSKEARLRMAPTRRGRRARATRPARHSDALLWTRRDCPREGAQCRSALGEAGMLQRKPGRHRPGTTRAPVPHRGVRGSHRKRWRTRFGSRSAQRSWAVLGELPLSQLELGRQRDEWMVDDLTVVAAPAQDTDAGSHVRRGPHAAPPGALVCAA